MLNGQTNCFTYTYTITMSGDKDTTCISVLSFSGKVQAQHPFRVHLVETSIRCLIWIHPLALRLLTGRKLSCFCLRLVVKFFLLFAIVFVNICHENLLIHHDSIPTLTLSFPSTLFVNMR